MNLKSGSRARKTSRCLRSRWAQGAQLGRRSAAAESDQRLPKPGSIFQCPDASKSRHGTRRRLARLTESWARDPRLDPGGNERRKSAQTCR